MIYSFYVYVLVLYVLQTLLLSNKLADFCSIHLRERFLLILQQGKANVKCLFDWKHLPQTSSFRQSH